MLCKLEQSVLLVCDMQQRLIVAMPDNEADMMLHNTQILLQAAALLDIPVIATEQYPKGLGSTETSIRDAFPETTKMFEKTAFSCCAADGLMEALLTLGRSQIIVVGMETHVCVLQTAYQLKSTELDVFVVADATCSRKAIHQSNALQRMKDHGVVITNHESVLFEWLGDARHAQFKSLSALIR